MTDQAKGASERSLGSPRYLYVAHYRLSSLTELLQTQVLPLIDSQPKSTACARTVQGFLVRALAWALSLRKLSEVVDFQAQSSGCRALFEMSIDLALLVSGAESAEKLLAWEECAKLSDARAAQAVPLGQPTMVDLAQQNFILQHEARCAQQIATYWPGSKKKQPQRWTGHQLAQDAVTADGLFGRECFHFAAFAREHYARLN